MKKMRFFIFFILAFAFSSLQAQELLDYQPKILLVTAHPDDDALFSVTVWKTTKLLNGVVDLAMMTNGEGGYKYSTLGNYIYGKELDKEEIGREFLPDIRRKELIAGGDIVGIRNYYFFDQQDFYYTLDVEETFEKWDTEPIVERLADIMTKERYDFVFLMLPFEDFHGHHKASAVLGLRAIQTLPVQDRPIALQTFVRRGVDDPGVNFTMMEGYPETKVMEGVTFEFDRNQTFGFNDRLTYNIIANWVIAEHKSQGTMQLLMGSNMIEQYWYVESNGEKALDKTKAYFKAVNEAQLD